MKNPVGGERHRKALYNQERIKFLEKPVNQVPA